MEKLKRNSVFISVVCAIILLFSVSFIRNFDNSSVVEDDFQQFLEVQQPMVEHDEEIELQKEEIVVDVKGAVNQPGVYKMKSGDRIVNVIEKAEGFHKEANIDLINLAALLEDEMVIYVPFYSDEDDQLIEEFIATTFSNNTEDGKININHATVEELQTIPGIGPARAGAIVANREEQGRFQSIDDLVRVSGIGEKTLDNMREFIVAD
ncbi:hypothetical protein BKP35_04130 [Anaerobacillus arseniciselenatis]|uniref:Helix-hairpin-helix DNA-binding motif class 1 domain-containing protein n=1 Tax=Anaerobacillus arseniciselenatis TaxID=85682 RepID=A0A1S2LVH5_9BACI|nr:ComEA family DNA-binding protein [Anaerobacillus arseniciselenatis]OIJ16173.1 hypothetical protein BKP35_04130 [Anaerobacillus arseniciselenatis]